MYADFEYAEYAYTSAYDWICVQPIDGHLPGAATPDKQPMWAYREIKS